MPWWEKWPLEAHALFSALPPEYHHFARGRIIGKALLFTGVVDVADAGQRTVTVIFPGRPSRVRPIVMADGPERSRHRFHRYRISDLCIYFSGDGEALRWTLSDGMTGLLDLARVHLLKEAWWRTEQRWPSPEVHRDPDDQARAIDKRERGEHVRGRARRARWARRACWCGRARYARCHGAGDAAHERELLGLPAAT